MSRLLDLSIGITRSWAAPYTRGLPHDTRAERREEIDSDLWDHKRLADLEREPANGTAAQILARVALGIPADLLWRIEAGSSTQLTRRTSVNEALYMRALVSAGVVLAIFLVVIGIASIVGSFFDPDAGSGWVLGGGLTALAGVSVAAGLLISRSNPLLGIGLVAVGAITVGFVWYWAQVITIPVGIAIVAIAFFRACSTGWPRRAGTGSPTGTGTA